MKWEPIETAPKDGTWVLLWFPHRNLAIGGCWDWAGEGDWEMGIQDWQEWRTDDDVVIQEEPGLEPTHWMPLPEPPK